LDYETGKTFWRQGALANRRLTAPLPMGSLIAVGDLEGYVHFLTRDEGNFAARIKLDSNAVMSIISGANAAQLIAETRDGGLYAISVTESSSKPAEKLIPEPRKTEPSAAESDTPGAERSILFTKDPMLMPAPDSDSGSGIRLPSTEP
jgi:hypothetical protein